MVNDFQPFSLYRSKDYVTPRTRREIWGYDCAIDEVESPEPPVWVVVSAAIGFIVVLYGIGYVCLKGI